MPKKKGPKGTKVTLKMAKQRIRMTLQGRRRLTLSNMGITIFPKCLFKLTNVDELDLSRNLVQKLPDDIGNFSSLTWLDLHSNKLESVPESIGNLVGLTHLNLSNNFLICESLPSTLGSLTSLKSLNLGMNLLDNLPPTMEALDSLEELGLFDNHFISIPEFVKGLPNLTKLNMERNPVTDVQEDDETRKEKSEPEKDAYLVHDSSLCGPCLKRCRGEEDTFEEKRIRTYQGLMMPNSTARVNQDAWRTREVEQKPNDETS